jgi:ABC-type Zn2+ transport system substrate-binding protein/surface adhesin
VEVGGFLERAGRVFWVGPEVEVYKRKTRVVEDIEMVIVVEINIVTDLLSMHKNLG